MAKRKSEDAGNSAADEGTPQATVSVAVAGVGSGGDADGDKAQGTEPAQVAGLTEGVGVGAGGDAGGDGEGEAMGKLRVIRGPGLRKVEEALDAVEREVLSLGNVARARLYYVDEDGNKTGDLPQFEDWPRMALAFKSELRHVIGLSAAQAEGEEG